jgi:hypothetical protein
MSEEGQSARLEIYSDGAVVAQCAASCQVTGRERLMFDTYIKPGIAELHESAILRIPGLAPIL